MTIDCRHTKTVTNDRPDPTSEGAPDFKNTPTVKQYLTSGHEPRRGSTPRLTDRLTVGRNVTLTLTLTYCSASHLISRWFLAGLILRT
jgi:hypothetical protein